MSRRVARKHPAESCDGVVLNAYVLEAVDHVQQITDPCGSSNTASVGLTTLSAASHR